MTVSPALCRLTRIAVLLAGIACAGSVAAQTDDYTEAGKLFRSGQQAQALERVDSFLKSNPKDAREIGRAHV